MIRSRLELRRAAAAVLAGNDAGGWTRPAPRLYPHQWSWDSAFAAIGWAHLDAGRALTELEHLFAAQWRTGLVPYLVYDPAVADDAYFPDSARWASHRAAAAPAGHATGGLGQPPVHAIALLRVWETGWASEREQLRERIRRLYPAVLAWHRYLATARDPQGSGLVTVYHPWESGADNSPRWDAPLAAVPIGDVAAFTRRDTQVIADADQRPSQIDYRRYVALLDAMRERCFDESAIAAEHPFAVKDVFFSAVFAAANEALLRLHDLLGGPAPDRLAISRWLDRSTAGLERAWDPVTGLCLDADLRTGSVLASQTFAGLAPLLVEGLDANLRHRLLATLQSVRFLSAPALCPGVLPTTSPDDPAFDPRRYWRGPTWPVITWLFWSALARTGQADLAEQLRAAALELVAAGGFAEYFDPRTGEPLGSADQSWTAAVVLDWLAAEA